MINDIRVGLGYDSHRLGENRKLVLGGIEIPFKKGCIAHSDGDVLLHAIGDALLGSLALKDIGTHFPDHDSQYKNMDSRILVAHIVSLIHREGWRVHNLDATIIAEQPKIAPYVDAITELLVSLLNIDPGNVSVKAKTNEKLGFIGREEGIAAMAIVTVTK